MTIKHTHWLFGKGPNMEVKSFKPIKIETKCLKCIHDKVCSHDVIKLCVNYKFCRSDAAGCHSCIHQYTRFDNEPVPCFNCENFLPKSQKCK
jgi:hypothetical protein